MLEVGVGDVADGRPDIGTGLAEAFEVLLAKQVPCRLAHKLEVELVVHFPRIASQERVLCRVKIVMVGACRGGEPCMHGTVNRLYVLDGYVAGEYPVQTEGELGAVVDDTITDVEVGDHAAGVDPTVGAPSPGDVDGLAEQRGEGLLYRLLNGRTVWLYLPSVIVGAIVAEMYEKSLHN